MTTENIGTETAKTFAKRFNAQRAAKSVIGKDAQEGVDFITSKTEAGEWFWMATPVLPDTSHEDHVSEPQQPEVCASIGLPQPPDFSAKTHAPYRKKLAAVVALAEAGDVNALKAFHINPTSTSPKAIIRYRDKAIAALTA